MSGGCERAARRLAALSPADREWILARLSSEDVGRLRQAIAPAQPDPVSLDDPQGRVASASAADVARALRDEPDWLVALVLAKRRWPWDRDFLAGLGPARLEKLRNMAEASAAAPRPGACDLAVAALAGQLEGLAPAPAPRTVFDEVLAGMIAVPGEPGKGDHPWQ